MANQGNLWQESTSSPQNQIMLRHFRVLFESCYGPKGGVKMLVSGGGYLTVTSASSLLIQNIPFNHPIISVILNVIKSHYCCYEDYGLYIGIISSYIIEKVWEYNGKCTINKTLKYVCDRCLALLEFGSIEASLGSVGHLLALSESVLASKPCCGLSSEDCRYISIQLVKAFLSCVGENAETEGLGRIIIVQQAGPSTQDTRLIEGLLYPYPEDEGITLQLCENARGPWKLLLYTCMLTALPTVAQEVDGLEVSITLNKFNPIVSHFEALVSHLSQAGIRLVACQKVVHPEIQVCLRRAGIVVLHRLGTELAQGLQRLSGAHTMDTPTTAWQQYIGTIDRIKPVYHHDKLYLQLCKEQTDVSTLMLCNPLPDAANETEVVVRQALAGLKQLLVQPRLVPGAGCFESWLATKLRDDVLNNVRIPGHSESDIQVSVKWIEEALIRIPRLASGLNPWDLHRDSTSHHAWQDTAHSCLCGSFDRAKIMNFTDWTELSIPCPLSTDPPLIWSPSDKSIVDGYRAKVSALRHAFEACQAVLAVSTIIHT